MNERVERIAEAARETAPAMISLRRAIHAHPETGWNERATTARVTAALAEFGLAFQVREDGLGGHVDVGSGEPRVGFRADLDALPIQEETTPEYRSTVPGVMHACGHDVHAAIGVGIAGVLSTAGDLGGTVRIIFQPAEERIPGGAMTLRDEGVHRGLAALIAFHVDPAVPAGRIGARVGAITSASDRMIIRLTGPGGHTSRPHQTVDLLLVTGKVITNLPPMLRAGVDPRKPLVVVFGRAQGGSVENVIPTTMEIGGTVRVFDPDLWREMPKLIDNAVASITAPFGAGYDVEYFKGSPPVVNDQSVAEIFAAAGREALGEDAVEHTHQSLGSEDLAWFLEDVPGAMFRLGAALPDRTVDLHSASFDVDEACIEAGMKVGAAALLGLIDHHR
jgi:amidohydrolase